MFGYFMYFFVFYINISSYVSCTVTVEAPCPIVNPKENFDWERFKGFWYEIARYADDWQKQGDCTTIEYYNDNGNDKFNLTYVINNERVSMSGATEVRCAKIIHRSSNITESESVAEPIFPVTIIAVDYDRYCIGYECIYDEVMKIRKDFLWVATRQHNPDAETRKAIYEVLNTTSYIDQCNLIYDHLTDAICLF